MMISLRINVLALLACVVACAALPRSASAADVTLLDAINCSDFKHNADGSWYTAFASLNSGPGGKTQTNFYKTTITAKDGEIFTDLNQKCGATH